MGRAGFALHLEESTSPRGADDGRSPDRRVHDDLGRTLTLRLEKQAVVFAGVLLSTDAPVRIGNNHQATYPKQRFFFGWMDDIRIFEAALGREEVEAVRRGEAVRLPPKPEWAR